jgi:hypothetical protein
MTTRERQRAAEAFREDKSIPLARTAVITCHYSQKSSLFLLGSLIAYKDDTGVVWMSLAGYPTRTTRDRLNAVCEAYGVPQRFYQWKHRQFYGTGTHADDIEIGPSEWIPMAGELGMQAILAERAEHKAA